MATEKHDPPQTRQAAISGFTLGIVGIVGTLIAALWSAFMLAALGQAYGLSAFKLMVWGGFVLGPAVGSLSCSALSRKRLLEEGHPSGVSTAGLIMGWVHLAVLVLALLASSVVLLVK